MAKFLKDIIENEGISQAELSRISGVSTTTINKICKRSLNGAKISPTTKGKLTKGINKLLNNQVFKPKDIDFE